MALGVAGVYGAGRFVSGIVFGIAPNDSASIAAAAALMVVVGILVAYLPAHRASRVDPLIALKTE